jgi:hypothetical protein
LGVKAACLEAYFKAHPEYARDALALMEANAKAAFKRRGEHFRALTHCKRGHPLSDARIRYYKSWTVRDCLRCMEIRRATGGIMKPETLAKVKAAFERGGTTVNQIIHGQPVGGGAVNRSLRIVDAAAFYRYRRENPVFDRFVLERIKDNNSRGQKLRGQRSRNIAVREQHNDYYKILTMLPRHLPTDIRDDIVQSIFMALLEGSLRRDQVRMRLPEFVAAYNRQAREGTGKYGHFSLDAPISQTRLSMLARLTRCCGKAEPSAIEVWTVADAAITLTKRINSPGDGANEGRYRVPTGIRGNGRPLLRSPAR